MRQHLKNSFNTYPNAFLDAKIVVTMFAHRPVSWLNTITTIEVCMAVRANMTKTTTIITG